MPPLDTIDSRLVGELRRKQILPSVPQPEISPPPDLEEMPQVEIPSYEQKRFFETGPLDDLVSRASSSPAGGSGATLAELRAGRSVSDAGLYTAAVDDLIGRGLGSLTPTQILERGKSDPEFLEQYGLGKAYSYVDLAQEALRGDPNFDPSDQQALIGFAQELESRGLTNENREDIQGLATNRSVQQQIEKVTDPGKFLSEEDLSANRATAQRLASQYGQEDPDLVDFLADRLGAGESAFELSSFLQTTPQYQEARSQEEQQRVSEEAAGAREALNTELLRGQQEAFERATPSIIASYMRAGRLNSSGLNSALSKAQQDLDRERQGFLAQAAFADAARQQGYRREDFVGQQSSAFNQYLRQNQPAYQNRLAAGQAGSYAAFQFPYEQLSRQYSLNDESRARQYELEDYRRQQSDFNRYLDTVRSGNRESAIYGLAGSVLGAGIRGGLA